MQSFFNAQFAMRRTSPSPFGRVLPVSGEKGGGKNLQIYTHIRRNFAFCLPALKGNSPIRGNVCEADKRVPVSGGKGGPRKRWKGLHFALCI